MIAQNVADKARRHVLLLDIDVAARMLEALSREALDLDRRLAAAALGISARDRDLMVSEIRVKGRRPDVAAFGARRQFFPGRAQPAITREIAQVSGGLAITHIWTSWIGAYAAPSGLTRDGLSSICGRESKRRTVRSMPPANAMESSITTTFWW